MSEHLIFEMGEFEAKFPCELQYVDNHMWVRATDSKRFQFGFTAYAVRLLQDVYFLDWLVDAPAQLSEKQEIGSVESKKAESSLYSPSSGKLILFNDQLMEDPSLINSDKYGEGWLFEMIVNDSKWLSAEDYIDHLVNVWPKTQRTIKGQLH